MVVLVDIGYGNLNSIVNAFEVQGIAVSVASNARDIQRAEKLVIPGIGSFAAAMDNLSRLGLRDPITNHVVHQLKPILGICLGAQLLLKRGDEGEAEGLGFLAGEALAIQSKLKLPHVGWAEVKSVKSGHFLFGGLPNEYYFSHGYHMVLEDPRTVIAETWYGQKINAAFKLGNVIGVQFHPEKSGEQGLALLKRFAKL